MRVVIDRVSKTYADRAGRPVTALADVGFAVEPEEFVALQITWWVKHGFMKSPLAVGDVVDTTFIEAAVKEVKE